MGLLVDDEWLYRENRKLTARLKVAKFKEREAAIENIDYRTPRGWRKTQVLELAQNRWITAHQSVLVTGPSGAGKSYLAQAFGLNACRNGFTVQYVRLPTLLAQFVQARAQGTYDRLLKRLSKTALVVIDDFGLAVLTEAEKQDLLEAIEERYGVGATLVTSQLPIAGPDDFHADSPTAANMTSSTAGAADAADRRFNRAAAGRAKRTAGAATRTRPGASGARGSVRSAPTPRCSR
ncbi:MAG TPA: ATP-binding protein [Burkholderiaceae bacterium]|nr:ATP-binding protein [Burkholderiaceae bacterium]